MSILRGRSYALCERATTAGIQNLECQIMENRINLWPRTALDSQSFTNSNRERIIIERFHDYSAMVE